MDFVAPLAKLILISGLTAVIVVEIVIGIHNLVINFRSKK